VAAPSAKVSASSTSRPHSTPPLKPGGLRDWYLPVSLLRQLDAVRQQAGSGTQASLWATETWQAIERLAGLSGEQPAAEASKLLARLRKAVDDADRLASETSHGGLQFQLRHAGYALRRRVELWGSVARWREYRWAGRRSALVDARLQNTGDGGSDPPEVEVSLPKTGVPPTGAPMRKYRTASPVASGTSRTSETWATGPLASGGGLDVRRLLARVEAYEDLGTPSAAKALARSYTAARDSQDPIEREMASHLDRLYRNGNLRIAVSSELINRCVPQPPIQRAAVRDRIVGADVRGCSDTSTDLFVRLIPDPHRIRLGLEAHGTVHSNTLSASGPATFHSLGSTTYLARKLILIGPEETHVFPSVAEAQARSSLCDLETTWDSVPLISSLVRSVALSQRESRLPEADCQVEAKVAHTARWRLDAEADEKISELENRLEDGLLAALGGLALEAMPLEASTSEERIVWRGRLSGSDQLGSHTPRPQAPADSHISLQLHQSALHNVVDRLNLDGRTMSFVELVEEVAKSLGFQNVPFLEEIPADAMIRFADHDSIQIRCDGGQVEIALAVAELSRGDRTFNDFSVTAVYRPAIDGMKARLVRDGIIHLHGRPFGTGTQVALRGIFAKLFPKARPIDVLREQLQSDPRFHGLQVTQFVAQSGWIGLAVGPHRPGDQEGLALGNAR
jgi:hypothetical protein